MQQDDRHTLGRPRQNDVKPEAIRLDPLRLQSKIRHPLPREGDRIDVDVRSHEVADDHHAEGERECRQDDLDQEPQALHRSMGPTDTLGIFMRRGDIAE